MKIVILDGYTLNPGDLSWDGMQAFGEIAIYERTAPELIAERAKDAQIIITNKVPLSADTLAKLPNLKYIGITATGYNIVDIGCAAERGIVVTNVPGYGTASVSQTVFALLLELCQQTKLHSDAVREGEWSRSADFCFWKTPLVELQHKTMGIIGLGQTGLQVARIAQAFGMNVVAAVRTRRSLPEGAEYIRYVEREELLASADVVSLHCPLTDDTRGLVNRRSLALMKRSAFLINTARGDLIVEQDLAETLNSGGIAGAGLDVLSMEPPAADNVLLSARHCIITPHFAWATQEARARLMQIAVDNIARYVDGTPVNVVRP